MNLGRLVPFVMVAALGCRAENPAFEDGAGDDEEDEVFGDGNTDAPEAGSSLGESNGDDPVDGETSSSESNSSNDVDASSDDDPLDTSSDGPAESSSDGVDGSSEEDSSSESTSETTTDGGGEMSSSGGLDAPEMQCPLIANEDTCMDCMQNHCCGELDMDCFDGADDKCHCTLQCLSTKGDNCAIMCGAGQLAEDHAAMIYECGVASCMICN